MAADVSIKELVCDYLGALQQAGCATLPVDEEARAVLRAWMLAKKRGATAPLPAAPPPQVAADAPAPAPAAEKIRMMMADLLYSIETPQPKPSREEEEIFFRPAGNSSQEAWVQAQQLIARWEPIQCLKSLRSTLVWGAGSLSAPIMLVGDAPGYYDELERRPFCGETGAKLDGILKAMELTREQVYITHLVKYRPALPRQTTNNRAPSRDEMRVSLPVLEFEVRLVKPRVIIALGVIAARGLLQLGELPLSACREVQGAAFCGVPVVVTHNPSYLLRTTALAERRLLWQDMLRAMELAQLPVSEKQKGYFLPKK